MLKITIVDTDMDAVRYEAEREALKTNIPLQLAYIGMLAAAAKKKPEPEED